LTGGPAPTARRGRRPASALEQPAQAGGVSRRERVPVVVEVREDVAAARQAWHGAVAERPFVLLAEQGRFDPTRGWTAWAYCHVPRGSREDMTERIEAQVERFAPGFRRLVLARHVMGPADLEAHNRNLVGGDLNNGAMDLAQLLFRPVRRLIPYRTPLPGIYLCSAATPPGGGVHGLCGYAAARVALHDLGRSAGRRV